MCSVEGLWSFLFSFLFLQKVDEKEKHPKDQKALAMTGVRGVQRALCTLLLPKSRDEYDGVEMPREHGCDYPIERSGTAAQFDKILSGCLGCFARCCDDANELPQFVAAALGWHVLGPVCNLLYRIKNIGNRVEIRHDFPQARNVHSKGGPSEYRYMLGRVLSG